MHRDCEISAFSCRMQFDFDCRCHSCDPNCATGVVCHQGKLRVALYTIKLVEYGCVLSYDYHCSTDDVIEYHSSKCLCGAECCETLYLSLAASHFDAIMESCHTTVQRLAMVARACETPKLSPSYEDILASVGFGAKLFRECPVWLKCFCAQVIEFINHERKVLPQHLKDTNPSLYASDTDAVEKAEGVYGLRLQNLAITVDRVLSFLRRYPDHRVAPLIRQTDEEVANRLVFGENSIWSTLKGYVSSSRNQAFSSLKGILQNIAESFMKSRQSLEAAREVLQSTARALRESDLSSSYEPCAAVLEVHSIISPLLALASLHELIRT